MGIGWFEASHMVEAFNTLPILRNMNPTGRPLGPVSRLIGPDTPLSNESKY